MLTGEGVSSAECLSVYGCCGQRNAPSTMVRDLTSNLFHTPVTVELPTTRGGLWPERRDLPWVVRRLTPPRERIISVLYPSVNALNQVWIGWMG